jgi:ATP-dependent Zn protease
VLRECLEGAGERTVDVIVRVQLSGREADLRAYLAFPRTALPNPDQLPAAIRWHLGSDLADVDLTGLARQCIGMSVAEVARLVRGARALARRKREPLALRYLDASLVETRPALDEAMRWRVAVHEAGHAIAAHVTGLGTPRRIAIHSDGGYVETPNLSTSPKKAEIDAALITLMSGRAAELLLLGEVSAGAGRAEDSDLAKATDLATAMEITFGLTETLIWRAAPKDVDKVLRADTDLRKRVEKRLQDAEHWPAAGFVDTKIRS